MGGSRQMVDSMRASLTDTVRDDKPSCVMGIEGSRSGMQAWTDTVCHSPLAAAEHSFTHNRCEGRPDNLAAFIASADKALKPQAPAAAITCKRIQCHK